MSQKERIMTKIFVNPNRPFSSEQLAQVEAALGLVEVVMAPINAPSALKVETRPELGIMGQTAFENAVGYPESFDIWYPTGLGIAAAATMATLHGARNSRFPEIAIFGGPPEFSFVGTVSLDSVRNTARELRYGAAESTLVTGKVVVLNFSHPITDAQKPEIAALAGVEVSDLEIREGLSRQYKFDNVEQLLEQVRTQVNDAKVSEDEWQSAKIVLNLPALSGAAMVLLAEAHGRMGYFPQALRIEKDIDGDGQFHVSEIVDLEKIRLAALARDRSKEASATSEALEALADSAWWHEGLGIKAEGRTVTITIGGRTVVLNVASATVS